MSLIVTLIDQIDSMAYASSAMAHEPTTAHARELAWSAYGALVTVPYAAFAAAIGSSPVVAIAYLVGRQR